jgi:general secretion pathway protein G
MYSAKRSGFTLIELLVVLVIIGILMGLLVPVIAGAFRKGKEAAELAEIINLAGTMQKFKDQYGVYPPSSIVLYENGAYDSSRSPYIPAAGQDTAVIVEAVSIQYIRRMWPQMIINTDGSAVPSASIGDINGDGLVDNNDFYDWNGDNVQNGPWYLQADECLVFFLGGLPTGQAADPQNPAGSTGFGKVPQWPSQRPVAGASRDGPFFDMPSDRLVDRDNDGFWELLPFRKPSLEGAYVYFSSYDGTGYRPDDLNLANEPAPNGSATPTQDFGVTWQLGNTYPSPPRSSSTPYYISSPGPNPYTIGVPYSTTAGWVPRYHKPDGFQIISPGTGAGYGHGGQFPLADGLDNRDDDDNLTNLSGSPLQDGKL